MQEFCYKNINESAVKKMSKNTNQIKSVINDLTEKMVSDTEKGNYESCQKKIRAIGYLIHAITLIEEL